MNFIYICVNIETLIELDLKKMTCPFGTVICDYSNVFNFKVAKNLILNFSIVVEMGLTPFKTSNGLQTREWNSGLRLNNIKSQWSQKMGTQRLAERYRHSSYFRPEALGVVCLSWRYCS